MSLLRRIRHRASRRQLVREAFYSYIFAFVFVLLNLHFFGFRHYYPSFHREYLSVNAAALQALSLAFLGPVVWVLQEYVFRRSDVYSGLDWQMQRLVWGGSKRYDCGDHCCVALDVATLGANGCRCLVSALLTPKRQPIVADANNVVCTLRIVLPDGGASPKCYPDLKLS